jgi:hypothetical protein
MHRAFLIFRLGCAALLLLALANWQYAFYSLLRVCTTLAAFEVCWLAYGQKRPSWLIPFGAIVILWNPLAPIHLPRVTWSVLDVAAAILFVVSVSKVRNAPLVPMRRSDRETTKAEEELTTRG